MSVRLIRPAALRAALLGVLAIGLAACAAPAATGEHRAGLVVLPAEGAPVEVCVAFEGDEISGETLLARSGLDYTYDAGNPMGIMICSIAGTGCAFPEQACWCACDSPGSCNYWAYFTQAEPGAWAYSPLGARASRVRPGDVHGWAWLSGTTAASGEAPPFPATSFAEICGEAQP
jgi:hypothetical protein